MAIIKVTSAGLLQDVPLTWDKKQQKRLGNEVVSSLGLALTPASHPQQLCNGVT